MKITGLYVALAALLVLILSARVSLRRLKIHVTLGDGDDKDLRKRIRAHANATEYLPLGLLCLLLLELNATAPLLLHIFGCILIVGRYLHALALSYTGGASAGRLLGMTLTLLSMIGMTVLLLWQWIAWTAITAVH